MGLTRKFLSAMGIGEDQAEQIITAHLETVNPLKQERDDFKTKAEQLDGVQKELNTATQKLQEYENSKGKDSWKVKYDTAVEEKKTLQQQFDDYKADIAAKELSAKKRSAYKDLLKSAGISEKRLESVLKVSDIDSIELDEDGKIKGSDDLTKTIKDEWADFIGKEETRGADVSNPPAGDNGSNANPRGVAQSRAAKLAAQYHESLYGGSGKEN